MTFFVYILYSEKLDVFYKGFTSNLSKRIEQHCNGKSQFTSQTQDWKIVFIREFSTKKDALKYEKMLKRQNQNYIRWILSQPYNLLNHL